MLSPTESEAPILMVTCVDTVFMDKQNQRRSLESHHTLARGRAVPIKHTATAWDMGGHTALGSDTAHTAQTEIIPRDLDSLCKVRTTSTVGESVTNLTNIKPAGMLKHTMKLWEGNDTRGPLYGEQRNEKGCPC